MRILKKFPIILTKQKDFLGSQIDKDGYGRYNEATVFLLPEDAVLIEMPEDKKL